MVETILARFTRVTMFSHNKMFKGVIYGSGSCPINFIKKPYIIRYYKKNYIFCAWFLWLYSYIYTRTYA